MRGIVTDLVIGLFCLEDIFVTLSHIDDKKEVKEANLQRDF